MALERQLMRMLLMPGFAEVEGTPSDGILGVEVFKRLVVRIDYERRTLQMVRPSALIDPVGADRLPITFFAHFACVDGDLDGVPGQFWIDTGNRGCVFLMAPFVEPTGLASRDAVSGSMTTGPC